MNRALLLAGGFALVAMLALIASALPADELAPAPNDTVQTSNGHNYVCTGIAESKYDPRWKAYPLKFVVATVEGDYLGDFTVTLVDDDGDTAIAAHCLAPWLLVDVPAGRYTARVVARGTMEKTVDVTVDPGSQREITLHFEGIDET